MIQAACEAAHSDRSDAVTKQMTKWVDKVLGSSFHHYRPGELWSPSINLYEDGESYYLIADLAGVKADEIDLRVEKGIMTFCGTRATPEPPEASGTLQLHLMEVDHGRFCRKVELPGDVSLEAISASYRNGFLWVRMPKKK